MKELNEVSIENVKKAILSLGDILYEAEAIGIFGSLARGSLSSKSDIDIFVVVKEKRKEKDLDRIWWERIKQALGNFRRNIEVIVYSQEALEEICNWYVFRLASEGILIFDKGNIKTLFNRILKAAKDAGMIEEKISNHKFWRFKDIHIGEVKEVVVK